MKKIKLPLILINFKCYEQATGEKAAKLSRICENVSKKYGTTIAVAPQFTDLKEVRSKVKIPVFSQHIDPFEPGAHTGHITAYSLKKIGASGTLLNHSERRIPLKDVKLGIEIAKKYNLKVVCCSGSLDLSRKIAEFSPDFLAYEPPELIGTGIPVSKTKPEVVRRTVEIVKRVNPKVKVLCGAGISSGEDVKKALELGTKGVLVASAVVKAKDPKSVLEDFCEAII